MSRGPGKVQQEALRIINSAERRLDTFDLAKEIFRAAPDEQGCTLLSQAQIKSAHRALRALLKRKLICAVGCNSQGRMQWRSEKGRRDDEARMENILLETVGPFAFAAMMSRHGRSTPIDTFREPPAEEVPR
jgi:hypothetical protein